MQPWEGFELGRIVLTFSAVMYAGIWIQVSLFHRTGAFKHWAMYVPVVFTPLIVGAALAGVVQRHGVGGWVAAGALAFGSSTDSSAFSRADTSEGPSCLGTE